MTIEEIKDFLKDAANAEAFKSLVKGLGFESSEDVQGIKTKNTELLTKIKKEKEKSSEAQKILDGIDIDEYNELKDLKDKKTDTSGESAKTLRELATTKNLLLKKTDDFDKHDSLLKTTLKDHAISKALDDNKFDPKHKGLLLSAFRGRATVEIDDEYKASVIINDSDGLGHSAEQYFKNYAANDTGKSYLHVPENSGAGGQGMNGAGGASTVTRTAFEAMSQEQRAAVSKEGVTITD